MRILFVASEHPSFDSSGAGIFAREYVRELRKFADVVCVYFHLTKDSVPETDENIDYIFSPRAVFEAFSADSRVLEQAASLRHAVDSLVRRFRPDIIHCNDAKSFMPFRFEKNVFFSSHFSSGASSSGPEICSEASSVLGHGGFDFDDAKIERCALKFSPAVAVYSDFAADFAERVSGGLCSPIVLPCGVRAENFLESAGENAAKSAAEIAFRKKFPLRPPVSSLFPGKSLFAAEKSLPFEIEKPFEKQAEASVFKSAEISESCGKNPSEKCAGISKSVEKSAENLCEAGNSGKSPLKKKRMRVVCFSRPVPSSKSPQNVSLCSGVNDFVLAVNRLGKSFKEKHSLEFSLYGFYGFVPGMDLSLFDSVCESFAYENYENCLKSADIVVIPGRYEPFGFVGLEAMASGALVLCPKGLGMDMFAEANFNCLEIPHNAEGIANALENAVEDFDKYKILRDNAVRTSLEWTWERCVRSHLYVYRQIVKGRLSELSSAYRKEERSLVRKFRETSDVEKLYVAETERRLVFDSLSSVLSDSAFSEDFMTSCKTYCKSNLESGCKSGCVQACSPECRKFCKSAGKILVLTGVYLPEKCIFPENVEFFSVLNESDDGIPVRPECLPFDDKEFDLVFMCGSWEAVLEPCGALVEAQRVCRNRLTVFYFTGFPHSWQAFQIEDCRDFEKLTGKNWPLVKDNKFCFGEDVPYRAISFRKEKSLKAEKEITA